MSLLNPKFPILETYSEPTIRYFDDYSPTVGLVLLNQYLQENNVWYCMFTTPDSFKKFPIKTLIDPISYKRIVNKTAFLVLDLPFEPFLDCIDAIYTDIVREGEIPASQIIFMSNMYDANQYNDDAAKRFSSEPIQIKFFSSLEYQLHQRSQFIELSPLEIKYYNKKFISLNRRWRSHRPMFMVLLHHKNLIDKGHISFAPCENHRRWEDIWDGLRVTALENPTLFQILEKNENIKQMPALYLDTEELDTNRAELDESVIKFYKDCYFSVIAETTFYYHNFLQSSRFLTEKTFKSILLKHPFILMTIPKSLELLKTLGYKTFHPWIDESYDNETNDNKRMLMIADEVERLSNLTEEELKIWLSNVIPICEHNFQILKNKAQFIYA